MANSNDDSMLLALPRELRDDIYHHYLKVEGGYVYDFESGKLGCVTPAGARRPIDLALMLSCRQIAREMEGLALKINTITFSTVAPHAKRGNLNYYFTWMGAWWGRVFESLQENDINHPLRRDWWPVANFDDSVYRIVAEAFPTFEPHLRTIQLLESDAYRGDRFDDMMNQHVDFAGDELQDLILSGTHWGEAPSRQRQAAIETLKLISARSCWSERAWSNSYRGPDCPDTRSPTPDLASDLIRYHSLYKPWTILEDDASHDISADTRHPAHFRPHVGMTQEEYEQKYHGVSAKPKERRDFLSAASVAIHFLESIPTQRRNIRNIILDETHPCIAYSECHALGLIEFCKENPNLRVERRANLWRNIWQNGRGTFCWPSHVLDRYGISENTITERVACWVVEALALVPAGMPPGSFTLVLDGDPAPEQCAQLFQRVQRDAAWQTAFGESFDRGFLPETAYHDRRRIRGYIYEDFPQALRDISRGTCRAVRANFDVGEPWDVEAVVEAHREWKLTDWEREWALGIYYQTAPPLPEWYDLLREVYLPDGATGPQL